MKIQDIKKNGYSYIGKIRGIEIYYNPEYQSFLKRLNDTHAVLIPNPIDCVKNIYKNNLEEKLRWYQNYKAI